MNPFAAPADYPRWPEVVALIHRSFAYMEPILGHKPNAAKVTVERLILGTEIGTAHLIEDNGTPVACLFTRPSRDYPDALYLGGLAVDAGQRGKGLAHALFARAEAEAREKGYSALTLDTGRPLTDLHRYFERQGFAMLPCDGEVVSFRKDLA